MSTSAAEHWDTIYGTKATDEVSWFQRQPTTSQRLLTSVSSPSGGVIDVGAGASTLVDALLDAGWSDVTALDVSAKALALVRDRISDRVSDQPTTCPVSCGGRRRSSLRTCCPGNQSARTMPGTIGPCSTSWSGPSSEISTSPRSRVPSGPAGLWSLAPSPRTAALLRLRRSLVTP